MTVTHRRGRAFFRGPWVYISCASLLVGLVLATIATPPRDRGDLDPRSASPTGSRALTQILSDQGVAVQPVTSMDAYARAAADDPGALVLITDPANLGDEQLRQIAAGSADLVIVTPNFSALHLLDPAIVPASKNITRVLDPGCSDPAALAAGRASAGGSLYAYVTPQAGGQGTTRPSGTSAPSPALCYLDPEVHDSGSLVVDRAGGRTITVIGQRDLLRNRTLATEGNAALALHLLGSRGRLIWFWPDPTEVSNAVAASSMFALIPHWVRWAWWQVLVAGALVILWRARRFGPLVTEPLPVVVRAAETQLGRARLYRQSGARGRAAATLRTASLRRLAHRLDVDPASDALGVVDALAASAGIDKNLARATYLGPAPAGDADLVRLARSLRDLERSVTGQPDAANPVPANPVLAPQAPDNPPAQPTGVTP